MSSLVDCSLPEPDRVTSPASWPWSTLNAALPSPRCSSQWVIISMVTPNRRNSDFLSLTVASPPVPLQCLSTLLMLCTSDMYTLINYVGFINYLFYGVTVAGQIVLRIKQPDIYRPIKVHICSTFKRDICLYFLIFERSAYIVADMSLLCFMFHVSD